MDPRVVTDHTLDGGCRRVIVRRRIDADPQLGRADVDDLIALHGAPDMGADIADPWNGPQIAADPVRDPAHLRLRYAGRAIQVNRAGCAP